MTLEASVVRLSDVIAYIGRDIEDAIKLGVLDEKLEELYDDELKKVMKAMKKSPSTHRTQYLYSKYVEMDEKKAALSMAMFEKTAKTYPYPHEIEGERELISYAEERLKNNL